MIEASCTSRSTSRAVIAATLATSKPRNAFRNASRFPNTIDQLSPTSNTPRVSASNIADSSWMRVPQTSSWYRPKAVSPAPAQTQRGFPSCPMITSLLIRPCRDSHDAAARGITRSRHLVIARKSRQFHARVDPELREHVAEMAVHGVRRDEEALGDLSVCQSFGDEPGDGELRRRQRRPAACLGFGGDKAASHAELAQAAADSAGIPDRAQVRVESEGTAEN